jgi:hypothetical protein
MRMDLQSAIAAFGAEAKQKLNSPAASGQPEDQLRAPFETLLKDAAELCGIPAEKVVAVGESPLADMKTRPDYAVSVHDALTGFVELEPRQAELLREICDGPTLSSKDPRAEGTFHLPAKSKRAVRKATNTRRARKA